MRNTMLAAVLYGPSDVRIEEIPVPGVGRGEVRVRVRTATTCGTDVKVFTRGYHAQMITPPAVFGHELAGDIDAVGEGAGDWRPGDRVVAANSAPCGKCFFCARSHPELCEDPLYMNGAYAELVTVPARIAATNMLRIPDGVEYAHASLVEPLACVVHGVEACGVGEGDAVAVIGDGPIGLFFVRLCVLAGASVLVIGLSRDRLDTALALGASDVICARATDAALADARRRANGGRGFDIAIEAVGRAETWHAAVALARSAGTVSLFGGCPRGAMLEVLADRIHYDELTIIGTYHHTPATVRKALSLIADGSVPASAFVQGAADLRDLPAVLSGLANGASPLKTAIVPTPAFAAQ